MGRTRSGWTAWAGAFVLAALLGTGAAWAAGRGVTDTTIKIGLVMCKTGPVATLGEPNGQGLLDYFAWVNEQGGINGRKVEVIWEDDEFQAPKSVAAVKKLMTRDEVLTIITTGGTNQTVANLENIKNYKISNIPNALADEFFNPVNPYIFAMGATYEAQYEAIVDYIADDLKLKDPRIGVVYAKKEYGMVGLEAIKKRAAKYKLPVVAELVLPTGAVDASSQVLALQKERANIVITCDVLPPVVSFLKTAQKYNYSPVVFGFNWATDDALVKMCGEGAKNFIGVNFVGGWFEDLPGTKLAREIAQKYGRKPGLTSLYINGIGVSWLFTEAMKRAGKDLTPESLQAALETLRGYETGGIFPPVSYTSASHAPPQMVKFFKADVPNGRFVPLTGWRKPK
ncbi:MAG: ABC transporter substrate-binding protein [Deltaproteobacteria bacterium]|nr:ABC transporter substrate-binding protein [Deltaproteobacteria bacterium]